MVHVTHPPSRIRELSGELRSTLHNHKFDPPTTTTPETTYPTITMAFAWKAAGISYAS